MAKDNPEWLVIGDGYVDVTLSRPAQFDGTQTTVLRMREPTVADQLAMDAGTGGEALKELTLVANLCQVPPNDLKALGLRDYKRIQTALMSFIT